MRDRLMLRSSAVLTAVLLGIFLAVVPRPAFAQADKYAAAGATTLIFGPFVTGSVTADLLKEDIQSSNTVDLDLQVTLECGLITDQFGTFSFSDANVTVWIEIDGVVVPVTQTTAGTSTDPPPVGEVVFCDRLQQNVNFAQAFQFDQYIHANSFNWIKLNVGAGTHHVVVRARLNSLTSFGSAAAGLVRRRTLIIEPVHMSVSQDVQPGTP